MTVAPAPLSLFFDTAERRLLRRTVGTWAYFEPRRLTWQNLDAPPTQPQPLATATEALMLLRTTGIALCGLPVAVIGGRDAPPAQAHTAEALGYSLAGCGLVLLCGGRTGVMAAAAEGARAAGGITVGLLPDETWTTAAPGIQIALATGLGSARNAVIARAAFALVAVGGGAGTVSEIAFGLQFDRLVLSLAPWSALPPNTRGGPIVCASVAEAVERVCAHLLTRLPPIGNY